MKLPLKYCSLIILLATALTGCATFETVFHKQDVIYDRNYDYLKASTTPPLQIPSGVYSGRLGNQYIIPEVDYPPTGKAVSLVPPGSMGDQVARGNLPAGLLKQDFLKNPTPIAPMAPAS
jgi:uncharacterized lipoprotein